MKRLLSYYPKEYKEGMNFMRARATDIRNYLHSEHNEKFSAMVIFLDFVKILLK